MGSCFVWHLRFHPTHCHGCPDDALLVHYGQPNAGDYDIGKYEPRVGREWSDGRQFPASKAYLEPLVVDDRDHVRLGLGVLFKIDRVRYYVGSGLHWDRAVLGRLANLAAIVADNCRQLERALEA